MESTPVSRRARIRSLPFNVIIPNVLTLFALSAGVTAIRFGIETKWERAVIALLIAAILDALDGRIARLLRGTSKFGAELDSLSDMVCFGVAPAIILYCFAMQGQTGFGWALCLGYAACMALRLARFNTMIGDPDQPAWAYNYFTGVPAPAAALLVLTPLTLSIEFEHSVFSEPAVVGTFLAGVAFLMVSRIPTFAMKKGRVPVRGVLPLMLLIVAIAAFLVTQPWLTMATLGLVYLGTIPVSYNMYRRRAAAEAEGKTPAEDDDDFDAGL